MLQLITGTNCTASRGYTMPPYTRILSIGYGGLVLFIIDKGYTTLSGGPCGYLSQLTAYLTHGGFSVRRTTRSEPSRVSRSGCMLSCPVLSCPVLFCFVTSIFSLCFIWFLSFFLEVVVVAGTCLGYWPSSSSSFVGFIYQLYNQIGSDRYLDRYLSFVCLLRWRVKLYRYLDR